MYLAVQRSSLSSNSDLNEATGFERPLLTYTKIEISKTEKVGADQKKASATAVTPRKLLTHLSVKIEQV